MIIVSIIVSFFNGTTEATLNGAFDGAKASVETIIALLGVMCFWTGIMKVAESSGLSEKVQKILKPVISFLFPNAGNEAKKYIAMNMSANLLGMGNAATPMGIKAMQSLDSENKNPDYASEDMCMLVVLNTASLQIIPTTIIALRTAALSSDPFSVVLPIWIASLVSVTVSVLFAKLWFGRKKI